MFNRTQERRCKVDGFLLYMSLKKGLWPDKPTGSKFEAWCSGKGREVSYFFGLSFALDSSSVQSPCPASPHISQLKGAVGKNALEYSPGALGMTQPDSGFKISPLPPDPGSMPLPFSFIFPFFGQNLVERDDLALFTLFLWLTLILAVTQPTYICPHL